MKSDCRDCCFPEMSNSKAKACGCCEGTELITPQPTYNRPGLPQLACRIGTHAGFLETMKARLSGIEFSKLDGLSTREGNDPSIALLDAWATVADVLSFYQERIANEGYLRTARERRSILELGRLVGYALRPGVSSSVFLGYTIEDSTKEEVVIPAGSRVQSVPGPDELPQTFETSEDLKARAEWNNLRPRMSQPQTAATIKDAPGNYLRPRVFLKGINTNLKPNDRLLIDFDAENTNVKPELFRVIEVKPDAKADRTLVILTYTQPDLVILLPKLQPELKVPKKVQFDNKELEIKDIETTLNGGYYLMRLLLSADSGTLITALENGKKIKFTINDIVTDYYVEDVPPDAVTQRKAFILAPSKSNSSSSSRMKHYRDVREMFLYFKSPKPVEPLSSAKTTLQFNKKSNNNFHSVTVLNHYVSNKSLVAFTDANLWSPSQITVYALRTKASLFGHNAPREAKLTEDPPSQGKEWAPVVEAGKPNVEASNILYLDRGYDQILPGTYIAVVNETDGEKVFRIKKMNSISRNAYCVSGESLKIEIEPPGWWKPVQSGNDGDKKINKLRSTKIFAHQVELPLAEEPIEDNISAASIAAAHNFIELDGFYDGLRADQQVIISGELAALPGVPFSDLYRLNLIEQRGNPKIPGDETHTFIQLNRELTAAFKRDTVKIYGNVVKATHGETRQEVLGSGDSSRALQSFALKQKPLTYVSAANPSGVESTLKVFVNDVRWHEAETLADREPTDRNFIIKANNEDITHVQFGNGKKGMRLPTGLENIKAVYRSGIGKQGNVRSGQLSLLLDKSLGVKEVINPLRASGGADREGCDQGRKNAPIAVKALDRLVSVQDYEDFSRTYTGIGKARAVELTDGRRQLVHVTIAGIDNIPIDEYSDLFLNLYRALYKFGDPHQPIHLAGRELMLMVISAEVRILPDYQWKPVEAQLRKTMLETFSFERRELGQDVLLSEVFRAMQSVPGVEYVDVNTFGGIPEKIKGDKQGDERRPLLTDEIAYAVQLLSKQWKKSFEKTERLLTSDEIVDAVWCNFHQWSKPEGEMGAYCKEGQLENAECAIYRDCRIFKEEDKIGETKKVRQRIEVNLAAFDNHMLRPAQLAFLTPDVPETLILNQI